MGTTDHFSQLKEFARGRQAQGTMPGPALSNTFTNGLEKMVDSQSG